MVVLNKLWYMCNTTFKSKKRNNSLFYIILMASHFVYLAS